MCSSFGSPRSGTSSSCAGFGRIFAALKTSFSICDRVDRPLVKGRGAEPVFLARAPDPYALVSQDRIARFRESGLMSALDLVIGPVFIGAPLRERACLDLPECRVHDLDRFGARGFERPYALAELAALLAVRRFAFAAR